MKLIKKQKYKYKEVSRWPVQTYTRMKIEKNNSSKSNFPNPAGYQASPIKSTSRTQETAAENQ